MAWALFLIAAVGFLAARLWRAQRRLEKLYVKQADLKRRLEERIDVGGAGEAKLGAILSSMVEGVLVVDKKGAIVLLNPSLRRDFFIEGEVEGRHPLEVIRQTSIQEIVDEALAASGPTLFVREVDLMGPPEK
ncbi:MAG: hypothetical protein ACM3L6_01035, partial [Deltaproteobacteria bacterium]